MRGSRQLRRLTKKLGADELAEYVAAAIRGSRPRRSAVGRARVSRFFVFFSFFRFFSALTHPRTLAGSRRSTTSCRLTRKWAIRI